MKHLALSLILFRLIALPAFAQAPHDLELAIVGHTNDASGVPAVIFQITNSSQRSVIFTLQTQVKTNGPMKWYLPRSQIKFIRSKQALPPRSAQSFAIPSPTEGGPWRALAYYTNAESMGLGKRVYITTPEISK